MPNGITGRGQIVDFKATTEEERNLALAENISLIRWFVSEKMRPEEVDSFGGFDDAVQEFAIQFHEAYDTSVRKGLKIGGVIARLFRWKMERLRCKERLIAVAPKSHCTPGLAKLEKLSRVPLPLSKNVADKLFDPEDRLRRIDDDDLRGAVKAALVSLRPRQRQILVAYYGLDGSEPIKGKALASLMGVHRMTVSKLLRVARERLAEKAPQLENSI